MRLSMTLDGLLSAQGLWERVAERSVRLEPAFEKVIDVWEDIERKVFSDGVLVDTGRLEGSLTGDGGDAVREIHGLTLDFGTDVEYARPAGAKTKHKVLADPPKTSDEIIMAYLVGEELLLS